MKKLLLFGICFLSIATLVGAAPPAPGSGPVWTPLITQSTPLFSAYTFDSDNMDWLQTYIGRPDGTGYDWLYPNSGADWTGSNGNPPGCITQTVTADLDQRAYWLGYYGPPQFLGDLADAYLQCDVYSTGNWATIANGNGADDGHVYARWVISTTCSSDPTKYDMFVSLRATSIDLNSFSSWQTFSIDMILPSFCGPCPGRREGKCHLVLPAEGGHDILDATGIELCRYSAKSETPDLILLAAMMGSVDEGFPVAYELCGGGAQASARQSLSKSPGDWSPGGKDEDRGGGPLTLAG